MATTEQVADQNILEAVNGDMAQCSVPVRGNIAQAHALVLTHIAQPGTWWTGAERVAIAASTRSARNCHYCEERKAALSPYNVDGDHSTDPLCEGILPAAIIDIVHLATNDASRMTADAINKLSDADLTDAHFVEALGIAVAVRSMDQTCRGLGVPFHALPTPVDGQPSRIRPDVAPAREAFVAMLPEGQPGAPNDDLWGETTGNVIRAMSLVPDAVRDLKILSNVQYVDLDNAWDFSRGRTLGREQMELLAGRVSAINDCFY